MNEGDLVQIDQLWYRLGAERKPLLRPATELASGCQVFLIEGWPSRVVARVRGASELRAATVAALASLRNHAEKL